MKMVRVPGVSSNEDRCLTMKAYYSYMLHDRVNSFNYLSKKERLFQQYMVTAFCAIKDSDGSDYGGKLILPQSFTSGPRYMYAHYLDALSICSIHRNPSYFITFTCNVKWPEITEYMDDFLGVTTADRADIVDRVFEMKIHQFVKYLWDVKPFGKIIAKLLSKEIDPKCYRVVSEFMIHGPCGEVLVVHGQNMQRIVFRNRDQLQSVADNPHKKKTTLMEWLDYNEHHTDGRQLTRPVLSKDAAFPPKRM
ncbi:DNA helicase [Tanacetum coccineum]